MYIGFSDLIYKAADKINSVLKKYIIKTIPVSQKLLQFLKSTKDEVPLNA